MQYAWSVTFTSYIWLQVLNIDQSGVTYLHVEKLIEKLIEVKLIFGKYQLS